MRFHTIASRIFALVVPTIIVTIISFGVLSYKVSNARVNETIDEQMKETLLAADLQMQLELQKNASVAEQMARYGSVMRFEGFSHASHQDVLEELIGSNLNTCGGGVWFEPYAFDPDAYYFGPFLHIDDRGAIRYSSDYEHFTDYFKEDWYLKGKDAAGDNAWSKVYFDPVAETTMITTSRAFYNNTGVLLGVGTADMDIDSARKIVNGISVGKTGRAFIIGAAGEYVFFDGKSVIDSILTDPDEDFSLMGREIMENSSGVMTTPYDGALRRIHYMTMDNVKWKLAVAIDESEIRSSALSSFLLTTSIPICGLTLLVVGIYTFAKYLRRIISKVNYVADLASCGDFSRQIEVSERDEFGIMEKRLNKMIENLSDMSGRSANLLKISNRKGRLMHAVNQTATVLLSSDTKKMNAALRRGMEPMARCVDVDRVYIWRETALDGQRHYKLCAEWVREYGERSDKRPVEIGFCYPASALNWEKQLLKDECLNGPAAGMARETQEWLGRYGVRSILVIPVFLQDRFWGFVSFEDCRNDRTFEADEVDILRSACLMMASAIHREEAAAKVREADERTRIMLNATPLSCKLIDRNFRIIDCNEETLNLFGMKDKQEYIDRFFDLFPEYQKNGEPSRECAEKRLAEAFKRGRMVFEWTHRRLDGTPLPTEITLVRVRIGNEDIVAGYVRDLSENKKMLAESNYKDHLLLTVNNVASILLSSDIDEFSRNLWECMGMMAESVGVDRTYIWKNYERDGELRCVQVYEWSEGAEPQQGNELMDISYSESIPTWEEAFLAGRSINSIVRKMPQAEQDQLSPQGIISILVVPVVLHGKLWGFMGFDDCREERQFTEDEEGILRSGSLLIAHALLRNEMNRDIQEAIEDAKAASRAKSNFLSNMSHEIRTPLNAITGMTQIGKASSDVEKKNYALGKIEDASNHLLGVINDILDMSKIEASKFELSEVEFVFEKMLQKVVNIISFRIDEKKQRFMVYLDREVPKMLIGDDQRLAQVITNLLSNAVKFTPEGGSLRLDTHFVGEENGVCTVRIEVTDTGIGISEDQMERLFCSFEQAERSTSRKYGGTGLGLAISKHIIELMGGNIWVDSAPGNGAKFSFTVRLRRGADVQAAQPESVVDPNGVNVLVVDDEIDTREYFCGIVGRMGIACDIASDGGEALELMKSKGAYSLYFVDWKMPGMNGIELSRKIKERGEEKSIVIMISATEWSEIEDEAKDAGVDKFLSKPLFPSSITDCINEYLGTQIIHEARDKHDEKLSFKGYRILMAEDVEINREIVMALLEPVDFEIECAENGAIAVDMFSSNPDRYDMIFMDMQMPEMDGLQATRKIRALNISKARDIPIIAMTANVFREDIEKCREAGMDDHVGKPLDFDEVLDKVKRFLTPR